MGPDQASAPKVSRHSHSLVCSLVKSPSKLQVDSVTEQFFFFFQIPFPPLQDVTSWREGGGRNLQPSSLTLGLATDPEGKSPALGETGTPPASSHPSSSTGTTSSSAVASHPPVLDPKEPSLRPAQPIRRTAVPTALPYQFHHTSTAVYHDMLPAFVSAVQIYQTCPLFYVC